MGVNSKLPERRKGQKDLSQLEIIAHWGRQKGVSVCERARVCVCVCVCVPMHSHMHIHEHINLITGNICLVNLSGKSSGLTDHRPLFQLTCFLSVLLVSGVSTLFSTTAALSIGCTLPLSEC